MTDGTIARHYKYVVYTWPKMLQNVYCPIFGTEELIITHRFTILSTCLNAPVLRERYVQDGKYEYV